MLRYTHTVCLAYCYRLTAIPAEDVGVNMFLVMRHRSEIHSPSYIIFV